MRSWRWATRGGVMALSVCLAIVPGAAEEPPKDEAAEARAWMGVFLGDAVDGGVHLVAVVPGGPRHGRTCVWATSWSRPPSCV